MGREAQETCLKTWTNGGRFLLTRNTWYAHWNKPKEHVVTNRKEKQKSVDYATSYWTDDKIKSAFLKSRSSNYHSMPVTPTNYNFNDV